MTDTASAGNSSAEGQLAENNTSDANTPFTEEEAMAISQAVIGNVLSNHRFVSVKNEQVSLSDFAGKPVVISMIYTSCYHICPMVTENLNKVVSKTRAVLGDNSFAVLTVGFDTINDTLPAMLNFSKAHSSSPDNWHFLSADATTIKVLSDELGFFYTSSPRGFDHLIQATIVDQNGRINRQVYGITPQTPHFVEPLKELILGEQPNHTLLQSIVGKVRLFCTVYDPARDRYSYDYSIFVGLIMGVILGAIFITLIVREWRYTSSSKNSA